MHLWMLTKLSYGILKESLIHPKAILVLDKTTGKVSYTRGTPARTSAERDLPVGNLAERSWEVQRELGRFQHELEVATRQVRRESERHFTERTKGFMLKIGTLTVVVGTHRHLQLPPVNISEQILQEFRRLAQELNALPELAYS